MTDESQDQPVLSTADRTLLKSAAAPTDAQLEATRRALGRRLAALAAGAALAQAASTAEATGAATTAAMSSTATATATATHGLLATGAVKWISAGLIVTAVAGGTVVATRHARSVEQPRSAAQVPEQLAEAAPQPIAAPETAAEPPAPSQAPAARAPGPSKAASTPVLRRNSAKSARRAAGEAHPARALDGETLSAELALLHDARQALARGDAGAALQALDTHAAHFPKAELRQEALSARALALCANGRTADARRTAAQLERLAPRSPHLIRLADSCAREDAEPRE